MTLITLQDGKIVLRDDKVGTEQACCCGGCACSFREGSVIVVTVDGTDVELFGPSGPINVYGDIDKAAVCISGNAYLPDSYCESRFISTGDVVVYVGCHDADWGTGFLYNDFPEPVPIPEDWPNSGIVVVVLRYWRSGSIYPECNPSGAGGDRYFYYRMSCDDEGYPTTGELFHDSGAVEFDEPYNCFDCTNEPEINRDCEDLSAPSSVSVVVNPLP